MMSLENLGSDNNGLIDPEELEALNSLNTLDDSDKMTLAEIEAERLKGDGAADTTTKQPAAADKAGTELDTQQQTQQQVDDLAALAATQQQAAKVEPAAIEPATRQADTLQQDLIPPAFDPKDYTNELGKLNTEIDTLATAYDDGDLTTVEYQAKLRDLTDARTNLLYEQRQLQDYNTRVQQNWTNSCQNFVFGTAKDFYTGADGKANEVKTAALDAIIKASAKDFPAGTPFNTILQSCHDKLMDQFGISKPASTTAQDTTKPAASKKPELPPSLGAAPAAEAAGTESRFGTVDSLKGVDAEEAINRMTPQQYEAYLRGQ